MLNHLCSSDLYALADSLLGELQRHPPENSLRPETFVVQNYGMARWLSLYIAEREGIAANLEFKFPAELYWQVMRLMDSEIPENLPSERIPMNWAIFQILVNDDNPELSRLYQYVQNDDPVKQEMRCWNLGCRIADVFDQYLTYRPEMLLNWEQSLLVTGFDSEKWQAHLWRKLNRRWKKRDDKKGTHRARLHEKLVNEISAENFPFDKLPPRISVFGVSEMPEAYIKVFIKLSKLTNVNIYSIDISNNAENVLVKSLGKAGIEFKSLVKKHIKADDEINNFEITHIDATRKEPENFFQQVKHDLISGENHKTPELDNSVQFHSCHSPRREIEVLYDQLLHLLDENEDLNPADILVICPQMEEYGTEIEAIFGAVEEKVPEIPYHLAERADEVNIVDLTFRKLLRLMDSRFKVTDVLDLLDCKPIRNAFSLAENNVNTLERWIGDNNIRWGISGEQKQSLDLPKSDSFTWQSGLNRMMAGYAMQPVDDNLFQCIYPYDEIQQLEHAQLLGRFSKFLNRLFSCYQQVDSPKSLTEWSTVISEWLSAFFPEEEAYFREMQQLREIIQSLREQAKLAEMNSNVSFQIIRSYLEDMLEQKGTGGGRPGTGVTFSGMVSMRNISAKVVCMIGMNDGIFPRSKNAVEFNLITKNPREGDRLPGKEDRQIFLENILAARNKIYFSYVGQSNKKEIEYPPSVVLREFIDYLVERYKIINDEIVQYHKLQPFSSSYFKKNKGNNFFSYSVKHRRIVESLSNDFSTDSLFLAAELSEPDESFKKLSVNEFISFFQHPSKFLLQRRLGIYLYEEEVLDEDRESFDLNALQKFQIGQEMMERFLEGQSLQSYKDVASAKDLLPESWPGDQAFNARARKVNEFGQKIREVLQQEKLEPIEVNFEEDDFQIIGKLDQIYEQEQVLYRFGKVRSKDLIELWIKHLLFQTGKPAGHSGRSTLFTRDKKKGIATHQFISISNVGEILQKLFEMYRTGLEKNIHFYPAMSFAYAEKVIYKNKDEEEGIKAAHREWVDRFHGYPKEGDDPYNKQILKNVNPLEDNNIKEAFKQYSVSFWKPFFIALNEGGERQK